MCYTARVAKVVLVVEDEPSMQRWIRQHLTENGFAVLVAPHVQAAVAILATTAPDVVCVDLVLPRESGYDLCEVLRKSEKHSHVPIIAISSRNSPVERAHAAEAGASRYLLKPSELERLAVEIGELLGEAEGNR